MLPYLGKYDVTFDIVSVQLINENVFLIDFRLTDTNNVSSRL